MILLAAFTKEFDKLSLEFSKYTDISCTKY